MLISLLPLLLCSAFSVNASGDNIEIRTIGFPPYGINTQAELSGIYYEMANILVSGAGYAPQNRVAPYARIIKEMKFGVIDLTIMFRYPELEEYVEYIAPLPSIKTVVMGLQGNNFTNIESLTNKKIAYLRGAKFSDEIDNNVSIIKYPINNYAQGVKMLAAGRADAIIGALDPILRSALYLNDKEILFGEPLVVDSRTPWIQISKKSHNNMDVKKLKASFLAMQREDTLKRLSTKYNNQSHLKQ
ncbi:hypothetical protein GCM10007916_15170 [Psychromonas marina]|uniref:Solute-binding protein family 3/N-terminal domain-containing protein n=2 Tax=Psychromonas marina TaxID=88364 RepID=A0ABQ6DZR9_9GAMM|nr:hypothetical protein GCM10007916_15170 [Psychromonas marina]